MENLRYLLAAIAALTLLMSVVSGVNPSYFAGLNVYADHEDDEDVEEEDDDNSGSSNNDDEQDDEEHDEEDDSEDQDNDESSRNDDEEKLVQTLGNNSRATLQVEDDAELQVEIEDGDLEDGSYDVLFSCDSPAIDEEFTDALIVDEGEGEFEQDLPLTNGTYNGCEVEAGGLSATFPSFTIIAKDEQDDEEDDDEDDAESEDDDEDEQEREDDREHEQSKLKTEDDGVQVEVEVKGLNMTDGLYDALFVCEDPDVSITLQDAFEVEDGEGKLDEEIGLANGTYSGCEIKVEGEALASFNTFTVSEESEDEQEHSVEEQRKEKRERTVTTINGTTIHERHRSANPSSPGDYDPGWDYTLLAAGIAEHDIENQTANEEADATLDINMAVWKSSRALILLDVIDGTVEIENQSYTVVLGYALYAVNYDTFRMGALAIDDDGNVYKLRLRGSAVNDTEFPTESGSIEFTFGGSSGQSNNTFGDWELTLEGTVTAG